MENQDDFRFTREYLFRLIADNMNLLENHLVYRNDRDRLAIVFRDSAAVAYLLEKDSFDGTFYDIDYYRGIRDRIISVVEDRPFNDYLNVILDRILSDKKEKKDKINYKSFVISVFRDIASFHDKIIEQSLNIPWSKTDQEYLLTKRPSTFLSYAYYDKGITLGLYIYLQIHGGFLYVNWMWSGVNSSSEITKRQLDDVLKQSDQFLFLRTLNSDFDYYGGTQIRQWCSWEIGNFYTKNWNQKYYINFYGKTPNENEFLSTLKELKYVVEGKING